MDDCYFDKCDFCGKTAHTGCHYRVGDKTIIACSKCASKVDIISMVALARAGVDLLPITVSMNTTNTMDEIMETFGEIQTRAKAYGRDAVLTDMLGDPEEGPITLVFKFKVKKEE